VESVQISRVEGYQVFFGSPVVRLRRKENIDWLNEDYITFLFKKILLELRMIMLTQLLLGTSL
jgi:hypothetical protein